MKQLIADLHPIRSGVVCDGLDQCMERLKQELPFQIHEFDSGTEINGWIIPQRWECQTATIRDVDGNLLYDGNAHPLGVIAYSQPFIAGIGGEELKKHLFYSDKFDTALIYHCDLLYKPHVKEWGFSVGQNFYKSIDDKAAYHVELRTTFTKGTMKVAEYVLPGSSDEGIVLCAHICHPGCSNDDLSGVAVGIEVMSRLEAIPNRRFTYRLLILPEHYGSIAYLDRFGKNGLQYGLFLESLGTTGSLALQRSFTGEALIDRALINVLEHSGFAWRTEAFRKIVGNDETCIDSAGYEIACPSLSRVPFDAYHTSFDCPDLMDEEKLREAVTVVCEALECMENNITIQRRFIGLVCLSNPRYDLYQPMADPSIPGRRTVTPLQRSFNYLMDCIPRYMDGTWPILTIAEKHNLPWRSVHNYIQQWKAKGLVE